MRRRDHRASTRGNYSVRLAGFMMWDEHLPTLTLARRSAEEPRAMGLEDVHITNETTGVIIE